MAAPTRRAVRPNLRGLPNDPRPSTASLVPGSCCHQSSRSLPDTSALSPSETNEEMPMPSRVSCSSRAVPIPPDCTARPARPAAGRLAAKVAFRPMPGTATPRAAGPTSRMPWRRQHASRAARPAGSSPEVITTSAPAPRRPHSSATSRTAGAGTLTTTRSTGSGRAAADRRHRMPSSSLACGCTTYTRPP